MAKKKKDLLPEGTLVCPPIVIPGLAIPWKTPTVTRRGTTFKDKTLVAWQLHVATCAHRIVAGQPPYEGPVKIELLFVKKCPKSRKPGEYWDVRPDLDNLTKAVKDALTGKAVKRLKINGVEVGEDFGRVLDDDSIVVRSEPVKVYGVADIIVIRVRALETSLQEGDPSWEWVTPGTAENTPICNSEKMP